MIAKKSNIIPLQPMTAITRSNPEAERAVIAALARNPDGTLIARLGLTADHFTSTERQDVFLGIVTQILEGIAPDAATLRGALADAALIEYETSLSENASAANLDAWVSILKECHRERAIQAARARLVTASDTGAPSNELKALADAVHLASHAGEIRAPGMPPLFRGTTEADCSRAVLHPRCIVENLLYADLAQLCAPGGTGKTTLLIYEAVHIAIGRDLWGCRVLNPGKTLFITAEDSEELFTARLREVIAAMNLSAHERRVALDSIMIWDVSGELTRLAEIDPGGNIVLTGLADSIVDTYREDGLAQVVFDPAVSFGPGERLVNDAEQSVVVACRRIKRGLDCAVRLCHHTGKMNARNGTIDQYSGRGGSAFADGCRMVTVFASAADTQLNPPDGFELFPGDSGFVMARAKLSYAPPQPNIWIRRRGWSFEYFHEERRSLDEAMVSDAEKVAELLVNELHHGRKYTARSLEDSNAAKLPRKRLRAALAYLDTTGRIVEQDFPMEERRGTRKTYLKPTAIAPTSSGAISPKSTLSDPSDPSIAPPQSIAPPYREKENGAIEAVSLSPDSPIAPNKPGAIAAQWRNSDNPPKVKHSQDSLSRTEDSRCIERQCGPSISLKSAESIAPILRRNSGAMKLSPVRCQDCAHFTPAGASCGSCGNGECSERRKGATLLADRPRPCSHFSENRPDGSYT